MPWSAGASCARLHYFYPEALERRRKLSSDRATARIGFVVEVFGAVGALLLVQSVVHPLNLGL